MNRPFITLFGLYALLAVWNGDGRSGPAKLSPTAEVAAKTETSPSPETEQSHAAATATTVEAVEPCAEMRIAPRSVLPSECNREKGLCKPLAEFTGAEVKCGALARELDNYDIETFIALVPDPWDSPSALIHDQAIASIQEAFAAHEDLLDRFELPWVAANSSQDKQGINRDQPGYMLFRKKEPIHHSHKAKLDIVFLVGETPKQGIHKKAFSQALTEAQGLSRTQQIRILGPSFSGSAISLRRALETWQAQNQKRESGERNTSRPQSDSKPLIISGGATAENLGEILEDVGHFEGTLLNDTQLLAAARKTLIRDFGWQDSKIALLIEGDTAYGTAGSRNEPTILFPSGLAALRGAREKLLPSPPKGGRGRFSGGIDFTLAENVDAVDIVPERSPLSAAAKDLALSNLIASVCSEDEIRYLGIIATDVRDRVFLAHRAREVCPDLVLFTLDSDLLLGHPKLAAWLDGLIVLSSYSPLSFDAIPWISAEAREPQMTATNGHREPDATNLLIRQSGSEIQEGVYRAMGRLIQRAENPTAPPALSPSKAWISVVSHGSLWPIARIDAKSSESRLTPIEFRSEEGLKYLFGGLSEKTWVKIVLAFGILFALTIWLREAFRSVPGSPQKISGPRFALWVGRLVILVSWTLLLDLAFLFRLAPKAGWQEFAVGSTCFLLGLVLWQCIPRPSYGDYNRADQGPLVEGPLRWTDQISKAFRQQRRRFAIQPSQGKYVEPAASIFLACGAAFLLLAPLQKFWMPGGFGLFLLRARSFSGGLSPILPLALIGGAFYAWSHFEIERWRLLLRRTVVWNFERPETPELGDTGETERATQKKLAAFPGGMALWVIFLIAALALLYLADTIQPIAETRTWSRVFGALILLGILLCALSFIRFIQVWLGLTELLDRLVGLDLETIYGPEPATKVALRDKIDWKPLRALGVPLPRFHLIQLAIAKLKVAAGNERLNAELDRLWLDLLAEESGKPKRVPLSKGSPATTARARLLDRLDHWTRTLPGGFRGTPAVRDFLGVRLVAFLYRRFSHLRITLLGTLVPGFLLLAAVATYRFQPGRLVFLLLTGGLLASIVYFLYQFVEIERNPSLSRITGSVAGAISWRNGFLQALLSYGLVPLLLLGFSQFPELAQDLIGFLNPLLRAMELPGLTTS